MTNDKIETKTCIHCGKTKPINEFSKNPTSKSGYANVCKACRNKQAALQRDKHREKINTTYRERYANDSEFKAHRKEVQKKSYANMRKDNPVYFMWQAAKSRAKKENIPFDIEMNDLIIPDYCPLLGIKLEYIPGKTNNPNTPSLDKIDPTKGYVKGNVRVISYKANTMKNNATREELERFAKNILNYLDFKDIVRTIENKESIEIEDKEPQC